MDPTGTKRKLSTDSGYCSPPANINVLYPNPKRIRFISPSSLDDFAICEDVVTLPVFEEVGNRWKEMIVEKPRADFIKSDKHVPITEDGLLKKMVILCGNGYKIPPNGKVSVHLLGFLVNKDGCLTNQEPFFSTLSSADSEPYTFRFDQGEIIPGLNAGIKTMDLFETAQIIIDPAYAFGSFGAPARIPRNGKCVFNVRLMDYVLPEPSFSYENLTDSEFKALTFDKLLDAAQELQAIGIKYMETEHLQYALRSFRRGISTLEIVQTSNNDEVDRRLEAVAELNLWMARTFLNLDKPNLASEYCKKSHQSLMECTDGSRQV